MANFWGGWTPPRHSGTWAGARVASLRCHYPPPRRSQYSRNAEAQPHKSKTSCRGAHRRGTTTSGPGCGPLAGFEVTLYGRFWGDRRGFKWIVEFAGTHSTTCGTVLPMDRPRTFAHAESALGSGTHAPNFRRGFRT